MLYPRGQIGKTRKTLSPLMARGKNAGKQRLRQRLGRQDSQLISRRQHFAFFDGREAKSTSMSHLMGEHLDVVSRGKEYAVVGMSRLRNRQASFNGA